MHAEFNASAVVTGYLVATGNDRCLRAANGQKLVVGADKIGAALAAALAKYPKAALLPYYKGSACSADELNAALTKAGCKAVVPTPIAVPAQTVADPAPGVSLADCGLSIRLDDTLPSTGAAAKHPDADEVVEMLLTGATQAN